MEVNWFAIPKVVVAHMLLWVLSFPVTVAVEIGHAPAGMGAKVFAFVVAWYLLEILLYGRFLRQRQIWARYALAILTLPMGLLLLLPSAKDYIGES